MIIIHPDGTAVEATYTSYKDFVKAVNTGCTYESAFCSVPLEGGPAVGFFVAANDDGIGLGLPFNHLAALITGYPELYGSIAFSTYEECGEVDLIPGINKALQKDLDLRLKGAVVATLCKKQEAING